jgi:hypothetical protein
VIVGDVPIPVVHEGDGTTQISLYPYTDFYRKKYIYNHSTDKFEVNGEVAIPDPEIWHGVIVPPSKNKLTAKEELIDFFEKNEKYSNGDPEYTQFEKRMLYANFPAMEDQMNFMDYRNYERYGKYMEEMEFNRYNKHLLKELVAEVSADMESDELIIPEDAIDSMLDVNTEFIFNKYTAPLATALKIHLGKINDVIKESGRWSKSEVDTPASLITIRDGYAQKTLHKKQLQLEKKVDDFIKLAVPKPDREFDLITDANLKVKTEIVDIGSGTKNFTFYSYIDGKPVSQINSAEDCGIYVGQKRQSDQTVLENNSVYVEANRLYDPASMIEDTDDLEDEDDYKDYAGCVYNNSMKIDIDDTHLSPNKCYKNESILPLFSIVGSHEVSSEVTGGRCSEERMSYHPGYDFIFDSNAKSGGFTSVKLSSVINKVYNKLYDDGDITKNVSGVRARSTEVIKALLKTGKKVKYNQSLGVDFEVSASEGGAKAIDYFEKHVEPTNETIQAIKQVPAGGCSDDSSFPQIITPSTPADGIRYVEFGKDGEKEKYEYLDFYRVEGTSTTNIADNLVAKIGQKDDELSQKTGATTYLTNQFFQANDEVIEPVIWTSLSADQKLVNVIPKYLDKDSLLPTPSGTTIRPVVQPNGYEVLHIVAEGDPWGYQLGLNRAMRPAPAIEEGGEGGEGEGEEEEGGGEEGGEGGGEGQYLCGDPSGVEIWEWFDALQCWIEEEILGMDELFKIDDSCGAQAPAPEEEEGIEDLLIDPINDTSTIATQFSMAMGRKSLVPNEVETISIYPLNSKDETIYGYIDEQVHLELGDPTLGEFDRNDFYIFSGSADVSFTAKKTGTTTMIVKMGNLPSTSFPINVYDSVKVKMTSQQQTSGGQTTFKINVSLLDPSNNAISNVNTNINLSPLKPADGKFEKGGKVELINGQGETIFTPIPGPSEIQLISTDPYYTSIPHTLTPPPAKATALSLKQPRYIAVSDTVEIPVFAVDDYGNIAKKSNKTVQISLQEDTAGYATILSPNITLSKGKGVIRVKAGKSSGEIQLIAKSQGLKKAVINIPVLARMDSSEWANTYPQNLFASFVGFPAGDFLEEDYFGGTHLFNGKTEAVFSFITGDTPPPVLAIGPNYKITLNGNYQTVYTKFPDNKILLQAFDQKALQTLFTIQIPLNFKEVQLWEGGGQSAKGGEKAELEEDIMYLQPISDSYKIEKSTDGFKIKNLLGSTILSLKPNKIYLPDSSYQLNYNPEPAFDLVELTLTNGFEEIARVMLNFKPAVLNPDDFDEINDLYIIQKTYGGKSTKDPNGLVLYNPLVEIERKDLGEYYGLEGSNDYIRAFGAGAPIGEAVKNNLPTNGILLGDPTIHITTKTSGGLSYDASIGQKLFQDPEGAPIVSINQFNFNNDSYQDAALVMKDGRIRLIEGGPTEPILKDRGDIAYLADGAIAIERFDFKKDGYEDLLIATDEGRLAILHNDKEVITRTDQKIKVGKKLYNLMKGDMDADGNEDLVTLDSRGDIKIFYNDNGKFAENGKLVGNYGFSLKLDQNLYKDLDIRYPGLKPPATGTGGVSLSDLPISNLPTPVVTPSNSAMDALNAFSGGNVSNPSESKSNALWEAAEKLAEAAREDPVGAMNASGPPLLPWPEENSTETRADDELETYFAPVEEVIFLSVEKTVQNKDRPRAKDLDLEENLLYTIEVRSSTNKNNVVLADTVPDSLTPLLDTAQCKGNGCGDLKAQQIGTRLFFDGFDLKANHL